MGSGLLALIFLACSFPIGINEKSDASHLEKKGVTTMSENANNQPVAQGNTPPNPASQPQTPVANAQPGPQMIDRTAVPTTIQATRGNDKGVTKED